jgi:hypothetical protein
VETNGGQGEGKRVAGRESRPQRRIAFHALQLLPDSPDASRYASHASGADRSRLGAGGIGEADRLRRGTILHDERVPPIFHSISRSVTSIPLGMLHFRRISSGYTIRMAGKVSTVVSAMDGICGRSRNVHRLSGNRPSASGRSD